MIYRIRIILDVKEDVFRDIEIEATSTLEDLHHAITHEVLIKGAISLASKLAKLY